MKKENIVCLAAIRRWMQARYRYANRNEAFATLWYGWVQKRIRLYGGHPQSYRERWLRGYLKINEAHDFWNYICE